MAVEEEMRSSSGCDRGSIVGEGERWLEEAL